MWIETSLTAAACCAVSPLRMIATAAWCYRICKISGAHGSGGLVSLRCCGFTLVAGAWWERGVGCRVDRSLRWVGKFLWYGPKSSGPDKAAKSGLSRQSVRLSRLAGTVSFPPEWAVFPYAG